jgi:PKD repeat protein
MKLISVLLMSLIMSVGLAAATPNTVAKFTFTPTSGNAPLVVMFTSQNTNATYFSWNFGDGVNSSLKNPVHVYLKKGTYTVTLSVKTGKLTSTTKQNITLPGYDPALIHPKCHFTVIKQTGKHPFTAKFIDKSVGAPTAWLWTFGDGTYSRLQSPSHTYAKAGTYTVRLQIWNAKGACSNQFLHYIVVT